MSETATETPAVSWEGLTATVVEQLTPAKTRADYPAPVVALYDKAVESRAIQDIGGLPTGAQREVFCRIIRDLAYIATPRQTAYIKKVGDKGVRFSVKPYEAPKAAKPKGK